MSRPKDEENASQIRNRILDAAERLFADKGFDAAGIAEIAAQAKVTRSLIYYYFKNKEALLSGLSDRFRQEALEMKSRLARPAIEALKDADDATLARFLASQSLPFLDRHRNAIKIGLIEEMKDASEGPVFEFMRLNMEAALRYYDEGGLPMRDRSDFSSYALFMLSFPMVAYAVLGEEWCRHSGTDPQALREMLSRWVSDAFMNYLRKTK